MPTYLNTSVGNASLALTASAGSDRVGVLYVVAESGASRMPLTSLIWGTEELISYLVYSQVTSDAAGATEHCVLVGPIPESIIAAQSGQVVTTTWTGTVSTYRVIGMFFSDAASSALSPVDKTYSDSTQTISRTLTVPTGGIMTAGVCLNYDATIDVTWTGGTEVVDSASGTTYRYTAAYTTATGSQEMIADWTASGVNRSAAMIAAVLGSSGSGLDPIVMRWQT